MTAPVDIVAFVVVSGTVIILGMMGNYIRGPRGPMLIFSLIGFLLGAVFLGVLQTAGQVSLYSVFNTTTSSWQQFTVDVWPIELVPLMLTITDLLLFINGIRK